jgi:inner membrane protein
MNPVEHFFAGWAVANVVPLERRDRMLVTIAGVIPDLDGFGLLPELLTRGTKHELYWWTDCHHILGHNIGFALLCTAAAFLVARRRALTALLVALSFHLHLLCDVIGARGPDGYQWPIPYLLPFSNAWQWAWSGQWALNAWQNVVIMIVLLLFALWVAVRRGHTPVELFSARGDDAVAAVLRARVGGNRNAPGSDGSPPS